MAYVRYQSPDDPAFTVFDKSRFRVDHAIFLLRPAPLRARIAELIEERRDWNLRAMKLVEEARRLESCLEWLESLGDELDAVAIPELKHEPAIDLVADRLIGDGHYERAICPACEADYPPGEVAREPWEFEEEGVTIRGFRSLCPAGHTIHVLTEEIDASSTSKAAGRLSRRQAGPSPVASSATNWPISRTTSSRLRPGVRQATNQGAADDQAVGDGGELADLLRRTDPEADADRQVGLGPEPGHVLGEVGRDRLRRSPVIPATET